MKTLTAILTLGLFALSANSIAGYYIGAGLGGSKVEPIVFNTNFQALDERDIAKQVLVGVKVNASFTLELGYADLGKAVVRNTTTGDTRDIDYKQTTLGVLYYPKVDFDLLGKFFVEAGLRHTNSNSADAVRNKTSGYIGIDTDISVDEQQVDLRLGYKMYSEDARGIC